MKRLGALLVTLGACRSLLGTLDECQTEADCAGRAEGLVCVDRLCVDPPAPPPLDGRCTKFGGASPKPLRLASMLPRTLPDGGTNLTGVARQDALLLGVEQLAPPTRGIRGEAIELLACDTQSSADAAAELAAHLLGQRVSAIFSAGSAETLAAARVTVPAATLLISTSATSPEISDLPDRAPDAGPGSPGLVWRTAAPDSFQGAVLAAELIDAGTPKVAVLELNDPYGQGLYAAFSRIYPIAQRQAFLYTRGGDVTAALDGAASYQPGVLLIIAFADDATRLAAGARQRPPLTGASLYFTDSARSPQLLSSPVPLEGAIGTAPAPAMPGSESFQWFDTQYRQRFGRDPLGVSATTNAFDALMITALAAQMAWRPGTPANGTALATVLTRLSARPGKGVALDPPHFNTLVSALETGEALDVEGASGALDFDAEKGEAPGRIELWTVRDGGFETLRIVAP